MYVGGGNNIIVLGTTIGLNMESQYPVTPPSEVFALGASTSIVSDESLNTTSRTREKEEKEKEKEKQKDPGEEKKKEEDEWKEKEKKRDKKIEMKRKKEEEKEKEKQQNKEEQKETGNKKENLKKSMKNKKKEQERMEEEKKKKEEMEKEKQRREEEEKEQEKQKMEEDDKKRKEEEKKRKEKEITPPKKGKAKTITVQTPTPSTHTSPDVFTSSNLDSSRLSTSPTISASLSSQVYSPSSPSSSSSFSRSDTMYVPKNNNYQSVTSKLPFPTSYNTHTSSLVDFKNPPISNEPSTQNITYTYTPKIAPTHSNNAPVPKPPFSPSHSHLFPSSFTYSTSHSEQTIKSNSTAFSTSLTPVTTFPSSITSPTNSASTLSPNAVVMGSSVTSTARHTSPLLDNETHCLVPSTTLSKQPFPPGTSVVQIVQKTKPVASLPIPNKRFDENPYSLIITNKKSPMDKEVTFCSDRLLNISPEIQISSQQTQGFPSLDDPLSKTPPKTQGHQEGGVFITGLERNDDISLANTGIYRRY
jgi:chemotaxis protein histidine kinase CheA